MSMTSKFKAVNQVDVEFELSITMTLGEWNKLKESLSEQSRDYPAWRLADVIRKMIMNANAHWLDMGDDDDE